MEIIEVARTVHSESGLSLETPPRHGVFGVNTSYDVHQMGAVAAFLATARVLLELSSSTLVRGHPKPPAFKSAPVENRYNAKIVVSRYHWRR
jgi:hypothetical protein